MVNLSNNKLSELTVDLLLKKKDRLTSLRILNLANNKLNERKIKEKVAEFKRMNVVVTLWNEKMSLTFEINLFW